MQSRRLSSVGPIAWFSLSMCDCDDDQLIVVFAIDHLEGITPHKVEAVSLVAMRKTVWVCCDRFQGPVEFPVKCFGSGGDPDVSHRVRPSVEHVSELRATVTLASVPHRTRSNGAAPRQSTVRLEAATHSVGPCPTTRRSIESDQTAASPGQHREVHRKSSFSVTILRSDSLPKLYHDQTTHQPTSGCLGESSVLRSNKRPSHRPNTSCGFATPTVSRKQPTHGQPFLREAVGATRFHPLLPCPGRRLLPAAYARSSAPCFWRQAVTIWSRMRSASSPVMVPSAQRRAMVIKRLFLSAPRRFGSR